MALEDLSRGELQALAKQHGIKANGKNADLIEKLKALGVDGGNAGAPSKMEEAVQEVEAPKSAKKAKAGGRKASAFARKADAEDAKEEEEVAEQEDSGMGGGGREELEKLGRAKLQAMAKAAGLKANQKNDALISALLALQKPAVEEEEEEPEAKAKSPAVKAPTPRAKSPSPKAPTPSKSPAVEAAKPKRGSSVGAKSPTAAVASPAAPLSKKSPRGASKSPAAPVEDAAPKPRLSSTSNMLREARCKRRSSASSRKSRSRGEDKVPKKIRTGKSRQSLAASSAPRPSSGGAATPVSLAARQAAVAQRLSQSNYKSR